MSENKMNLEIPTLTLPDTVAAAAQAAPVEEEVKKAVEPVVVDDSMLYIAITPEESSIVKLPPEQLQLRLELGGGRSICAPWHHKKVEMRNRKESLVYYFAIAEEDREQAWEQVGANLVAELRFSAAEHEELLSIHKAELAAQAGKQPFETWEELVATLRPHYHILFVGETHICLKKK
jgi:hypothetical protein